jgi:hypothetical protein
MLLYKMRFYLSGASLTKLVVFTIMHEAYVGFLILPSTDGGVL